MASTSSSPSARTLLALRREGGEWETVPLSPLAPSAEALDIERDVCVRDNCHYDFAVVADEPLPDARVLLAINETEVTAYLGDPEPWGEGAFLHPVDPGYALPAQPFRLTFGFVTMGVSISRDDGDRALRTREVPCSCSWASQREAVCDMLADLSSDDAGSVFDWMLAAPRREGCHEERGLVEGGSTPDATKSLRALCTLSDRVLTALETNAAAIRTRPASRTLPASEVVPADRVRRVTRSELSWLALNPETLSPTTAPAAGIAIGEKRYVPSRVRTSLPRRTLANRENEAVLSLAADVAARLRTSLASLDQSLASLREVRDLLADLPAGDALLPSRVMADVYLEMEEPLLRRLRALQARSQRILRLYEDALGAAPAGPFRLPRRSKIFQEVPHYAALWGAMSAWDAFGESLLDREALLMQTYRMDRLYEFYVLCQLLRDLEGRGFSPDPQMGEDALSFTRYTLRSRYFANEDQVTTRYVLTRGDERVTLWYQPVVYGDAREEEGIDLHRTTLGASFDPNAWDSYWTPDYLLCHERDGVRRRFVLDAKFSDPAHVQARGAIFDECLAKYRSGMLATDGRPVDGMWLLCGRANRAQVNAVGQSSWASGARVCCDGVATVAPGLSCLGEVLDRMGVGRD